MEQATAPKSDIVALAEAIVAATQQQTQYKHDSPGAPPALGYAHGPQGTFAFPGVDPDVYSTIVGTRPGLATMLPIVGSNLSDPLFAAYTGIQDITGTQPDEHCDNGPVAGVSKAGKLWFPFGEYHMATRELRLDRLALRNDEADPINLNMIGNPIGDSPWAGVGMSAPSDVLNREMSLAFYERAVATHRLMSVQTWVGNPANNPAGGGSAEFAGMDLLITTGHVDAVTNVALPSLDSDLKDFNFATIEDNGTDLVTFISEMYRFVRNNATTMGFDPVQWVFAMRRSLWITLTEVWPCSYMLGGCSQADAGLNLALGAQDGRALRDRMREERFILIDGDQVPIVIDDSIVEDTATTNGNVREGCFASDIYMVPLTVLGSRQVTFFQYQNFQNADVADALGRLGAGVFVSGGGQFLEFDRRTNVCVQWEHQINPRLIMRTPQLAGRIQNVMYCPMQHERESFPDQPYFVDGGNVSTPGPSYFAPWKS